MAVARVHRAARQPVRHTAARARRVSLAASTDGASAMRLLAETTPLQLAEDFGALKRVGGQLPLAVAQNC